MTRQVPKRHNPIPSNPNFITTFAAEKQEPPFFPSIYFRLAVRNSLPKNRKTLMNLTILRRAAFVFLWAGVSMTSLGQDLIARQAPVDRRLRAVDSVAIQRAVERDAEINYSSEIYSSWVTTQAHPYKQDEVPIAFVSTFAASASTTSRNVTSRFGYVLPSVAFTRDRHAKCTQATPLFLLSTAKYVLYVTMLEDTENTSSFVTIMA